MALVTWPKSGISKPPNVLTNIRLVTIAASRPDLPNRTIDKIKNRSTTAVTKNISWLGMSISYNAKRLLVKALTVYPTGFGAISGTGLYT